MQDGRILGLGCRSSRIPSSYNPTNPNTDNEGCGVASTKIPHHKVGSHRRIRLKDFLAYKKKYKKDQREALDELTKISQELDLDY